MTTLKEKHSTAKMSRSDSSEAAKNEKFGALCSIALGISAMEDRRR